MKTRTRLITVQTAIRTTARETARTTIRTIARTTTRISRTSRTNFSDADEKGAKSALFLFAKKSLMNHSKHKKILEVSLKNDILKNI